MGRHREISVAARHEYQRLFMRFYNALLRDNTGVGLYNSPARRVRKKAYRKANPEAYRASDKAAKHRRRGALGRFTTREWLECKARYGSKCLACGLHEKQLAGMGRVLAADHVVALATGGSNTIDNIQPLCHGVGGCNNLKGTQYADYRLCNTPAHPSAPPSATAASATPPMKWRSV